MKKLLSLLFLGSLTLTACGGAGAKEETGADYSHFGPGAWDGVVTDEMKDAYELIEGKDMLTDISKNSDYAYNHKDTISRIIAYTNYYATNHDINDLVTSMSGDYKDFGSQITSSSNVLLSSQGGPTRSAHPSYFDITYDIDSTADVDDGDFTNIDKVGLSTATDGGFTTDITGADGMSVAPLWNDGSNGEDLFLINAKQAQAFHHGDDWLQKRYAGELLTADGFDTAFAYDMNLRSVAIFEVVSEYFEDKNTAHLNLLTHSFGSMLAPLWQGTMGWLNHEETNANRFDSISIVAGRLEMPEAMIDCAVTGSLTGFQNNSDGSQSLGDCNDVTQAPSMIDYINELLTEKELHEDYASDPVWQEGDTFDSLMNKVRSQFLMQGGFGTIDFTEMLDEYSGAYDNTDYWHGGKDPATGKLSDKENSSIDKHYGSNNYFADNGHGVSQGFNVYAPGSVWEHLDVTKLREA